MTQAEVPVALAAWHDVGEPDDFQDGAAWPVVVEGVAIAMFRDGSLLHALHDLCTHGAARLSDGYIENGCVECPLHQGLFKLATGEACGGPVTEGVRTYPVRVHEGRVQVAVPAHP
ncbi:non-heme iron oxygenase ferredoxin subunit [uncultured Ramlibacter sp.]|uniref:non-heme iron oxygenase ferredoxin subunit n=1 Tax=uncultured Ramlibacter sp. TaxID=260755 RepID=UPI0026177648|nr:non-heme iron oxygenase ferredoxin subunit [uncultured Ramlibacter sp.]